jgi:hypothetical protein
MRKSRRFVRLMAPLAIVAVLLLLAGCNPLTGSQWKGSTLWMRYTGSTPGWLEVQLRGVQTSAAVAIEVTGAHTGIHPLPCVVDDGPAHNDLLTQCDPVVLSVQDERVGWDTNGSLGYRRFIQFPGGTYFGVELLVNGTALSSDATVDVRVVDDTGHPLPGDILTNQVPPP